MSINQNPGPTNALLFKIYYTKDFGQTWQQGTIDCTPSLPFIAGGGDPVFAFDKTGKLYFCWLYLSVNMSLQMSLELFWAHSEDGGATWTREADGHDIAGAGQLTIDMMGNITGMTGKVPDKEWLAVNPVNNELYVSLTEMSDLTSSTNIWGVKKKEADSTVFTETTFVPGPTHYFAVQGSVDAGNDGVVNAVYPCLLDTTSSEITLFHSSSPDGGASFSTPVKIASLNGDNFTAFNQQNNSGNSLFNRMYPSCYISVDKSNGPNQGDIYVIWNGNDTVSGNGLDVYMSKSDDGGATWSLPVRVNDDPPGIERHQHRPSVYVNSEGTVVAGWFDTRSDSMNHLNDYYIAFSKDGGQNFSQNIKVTNTSFDISILDTSMIIGEYYQILASKGYAIPFWTNWDGTDLEVYCSFVPFSGSSVVHEQQPVTDKFVITNIYPNPATTSVNVEFTISEHSEVVVSLVGASGKSVKEITDKSYTPGTYKITTDLKNTSPGVYFISIDTKFGKAIRKIIVG
jgi:hypothetical protein